MAVIHFAYTFDPQSFVTTLRDCVGRDGRVDLGRLHGHARSALEAPSMAAREALVAVRYSETWIEAPEDEADLPEKWFVIALTEHFTFAPSLGRRGPAHHVILKALLPGAGVSDGDIQRLLHGDDLLSMVSDTEIGNLAGRLDGLRDFGGWLSPASIGGLSRELLRVRGYFLNIRQEQQAVLAHINSDWATGADTLAGQAYEAAQAMLEFAQRRRQALFVILD